MKDQHIWKSKIHLLEMKSYLNENVDNGMNILREIEFQTKQLYSMEFIDNNDLYEF